MATKDWLIDIQENGDDGTGHCDYAEVMCDFCGEYYEYENNNEDQ